MEPKPERPIITDPERCFLGMIYSTLVEPHLIWRDGVVETVVGYGVGVRPLPVKFLLWQLGPAVRLSGSANVPH